MSAVTIHTCDVCGKKMAEVSSSTSPRNAIPCDCHVIVRTNWISDQGGFDERVRTEIETCSLACAREALHKADEKLKALEIAEAERQARPVTSKIPDPRFR